MSKKKWEQETDLDPIEAKIKAIRESKMPDSQKEACINELLPKGELKIEGVPFSVYAKMRNIPKTLHKAMQTYPKAKNVSLATYEKWDEIFTEF